MANSVFPVSQGNSTSPPALPSSKHPSVWSSPSPRDSRFFHPPTPVKLTFQGAGDITFPCGPDPSFVEGTFCTCETQSLGSGGGAGRGLCLIKVSACFLCVLFLFTQNPCLTSKVVFSQDFLAPRAENKLTSHSKWSTPLVRAHRFCSLPPMLA